jgi:hypothetical protein
LGQRHLQKRERNLGHDSAGRPFCSLTSSGRHRAHGRRRFRHRVF